LENLVRGQAVSQSDVSSDQNVEVSSNDNSESSPTTSQDTQERHQQASENIEPQQIEGAETTSGLETNALSIAEGLSRSHNLEESWQGDLEQDRRDWQQFSHAVVREESERNLHGNADIGSSHEGSEAGDDQDDLLPEVHEESISDDNLREPHEVSTSDYNLPEVHEESTIDDNLPYAHEEQHDRNHLPVLEELHNGNHLNESHGLWSVDDNPIEVYDEWQSDDHPPEVNEEWRDDDNESNDATDHWHDNNFDQPIDHDAALIRTANTFIPGDDDNVYSTELRELLNRLFSFHIRFT
jgi:hypothetical protein